MGAASITFDFGDVRAFLLRVKSAAGEDGRRALMIMLEGMGTEFLRILCDEIIRRGVVDTTTLLQSFQKGNANNVWIITEGDLELEIGSNLDYAGYVNDGHWTNPKGQSGRFVPGYWQGDEFIYDPSAKTGMYLKQKWVEGKHFWEGGLRIMERIYPQLIEKCLQEWLNTYFKDFI